MPHRPMARPPIAPNMGNKALVDLARKHHLHDFGGFRVRHAQAAHKFALLAHALEHLGNFRPAAVHQHDLDADQAEAARRRASRRA